MRHHITFAVFVVTGHFAVTGMRIAFPADDGKPRSEPVIQTYDLSISPTSPPTPLLKYELLPPMRNQVPGNRAPYYLRAIFLWDSKLPDEILTGFDDIVRRNDGRGDEFSPDEIRDLLPHFLSILRQLDRAMIRAECDWDLDLQTLEGWESISFSLEEFQRARDLARLLVLKGRLEVSEGRFEDAIHTLQTGYQLGRDVAKPPTIINSLIGVAFTTMMNSVLIDWIDQPDSPNLYWALATRPQPFIGLREHLQFELAWPERMFPVLRSPESASRPDAEWNRLVRELAVDLQNIDAYWREGRSAPSAEALAAADEVIQSAFPIARRELRNAGFEQAKLETMSEGQLLAIHTSRFVRERFDRVAALAAVPGPLREPFFTAYEEESERLLASADDQATRRESLPVVEYLQPSIRQWLVACNRADLRLDGLQCLEAIRAYAAAHDNQLPESLDDITETPCPLMTPLGQPFEYHRKGDHAVFVIPPFPETIPPTGWEFTLRVAE